MIDTDSRPSDAKRGTILKATTSQNQSNGNGNGAHRGRHAEAWAINCPPKTNTPKATTTMTPPTTAMSHRRPSLPRLMTALALGLLGMARAAEFTNSFDDVVGGAALTVSWDGIPKEAYPLSLTGQVIEMTGDRNGQNVNQFRANVSCKC